MPPHQLHPDSAGLPGPPVSAAGTKPRPHWARVLPAPLPVQCPPLRLSDGPAALCSRAARHSSCGTAASAPHAASPLEAHTSASEELCAARPAGVRVRPVGRGGAETRQWGASRPGPAVLDAQRALAPTSKKHRYRCLAPRFVTPKVTGSELSLPQKRAVFERFCNRV